MSAPLVIRRVEPLARERALAFVDAPGSALLEGWSDEPGWRTILPWPERIIEVPWREAATWRTSIDEIDRAAPQVDNLLPEAPFLGGWVGFLAYDAGALHEAARLYDEQPPEPPAWFALHRAGIVARPDGAHFLFAPAPEIDARAADLHRAVQLTERPVTGRFRESNVEDSLPGTTYTDAVETIRESIACGDVYQVNLTRRFLVRATGDARALYVAMTGDVPPRCSALIRGDRWTIVSASPEVFLRFDRSTGVAESRPIKGTIARRGDAAAEMDELLHSGKDDSEHLMIVDLVRNDLGRVAPPAAVSVPAYKTVRTLRHLHHLESTVRAAGLQQRSLGEILDSLFPAGSITGAPKRAAVHTIRRLEPVPRGVYTGAIGFRDERGRTELSVAIRTAVVTDAEVRYHAGGGIVWDSDPLAEDAETRAKSVAFLDYFRSGE